MRPTALIADDEPLLREALWRQLAQAWPELDVIAEARNGREAIAMFDEKRPDICFLDVHMPGLSGIDGANHIGRRAHLVFVTAFDHYAVQASFLCFLEEHTWLRSCLSQCRSSRCGYENVAKVDRMTLEARVESDVQ